MADFEYTREDDTLVGTSGDDMIKVVDDLDSDHIGLIDGGEGYDTLTYESGGVLDLSQLELTNIESLDINHGRLMIEQLASFEDVSVVGILSLVGSGGAVEMIGPGASNRDFIAVMDCRELTSGLHVDGGLAVVGSRFADVMVGGSDYEGRGGNDNLSGNFSPDRLLGQSGRDTIFGHAGNDTLNGGSGDNSMMGGTGDDLYVVDARGDVVVENAGEGIDTVRASISTALGDNVENLVLTGGTWRWGDGNDLDNALTGNFNRNVLSGKDGDDTLNGRGGADTLWGGAGDDRFVFDTTLNGRNVDAIRDFGNGNDVIVLGANVFAALDVGVLDATAFEAGNGVSRSAEARILYNTATGALAYDADGWGSGAAVQFALLQPNLTLTADDFVVV